jgi:pyruvate kinase
VTQLLGAKIDSTDELIEARIALAQQAGVVATGDLVLIVAGVPVSQPGTTNMVKVHRVGDPVRLG